MLIFASHFNDCFPDFNEIFHQLQIDYKSINSARNLIEETQWGGKWTFPEIISFKNKNN